jgi:hypothetical protein
MDEDMPEATPLTDVPGVGSRWADRLADVGIDSAEALAKAEPGDVGEAGTIETWRAEDWIESAQELTAEVEAEVDAGAGAGAGAEAEEAGGDPYADYRAEDGTLKPGLSPVPEARGTQRPTHQPANTRSDHPAGAYAGEDGPTEEEARKMEYDALWAVLSRMQKEYALARQGTSTKKQAAEEIDVSPSTVYRWPAYVDVAADRLVDHRRDAIQEALTDAATRAAYRLQELLTDEDTDDRSAVQAARLVIEQEMGKATQRQEIEHSGGIDLDDNDADAIDDALSHL